MIEKDFKHFYFNASFIKTYMGFKVWYKNLSTTRRLKVELGYFRFTLIYYKKVLKG